MDKKSRQTWQRSEHERGDCQQTEAASEAVFAIGFVERDQIEFRTTDHKIIRD